MNILIKYLIILNVFTACNAIAEENSTQNTIFGGINFTTDYIWRGQSQSWGKPSFQGSIDYNHPSGFFIGTAGSTISSNLFYNGSMEWDLYAGYNGKISPDLTYLVKIANYAYPGAYYLNAKKTKYNSQEFTIGMTYLLFLNIQYSYMLSDLFGINNDTVDIPNGSSKGSDYFEVNFNYEFPQKIYFQAHAGKSRVKNYDIGNYSDYKLSLSKDFAGLTWGIAYTTTRQNQLPNGENLYLMTNPNNPNDRKDIAQNRIVINISKSF